MSRTKYIKGECQNCRAQIEFLAEAAGTSADCPHCGKPTELLLAAPKHESIVPRKAIVFAVIGIVILVAGLIAAQIALNRAKRLTGRSGQAQSTLQSNSNDPIARAGFHASPVSLEKTPGSSLMYAVGTVTNQSTRQRTDLRVELDVFDASGQKIGTATDFQPALGPKAHWQFRALVVDAKAASARIAEIKEQL